MSDNDAPVASNDEELSLPKATVNKYVAELLGPGMTASKESLQLILDCCIEFIHLISSESNDVCEKESKKTISPEHVITALKTLGFESYIPDLQEVLKDHKQIVKTDRDRRAAKFNDEGKTEEELWEEQQKLFNQSLQKMESANAADVAPSDAS